MLQIAPSYQFINWWPTFFHQWKRQLAAKPQSNAILGGNTAEPTKDALGIKLPSGIPILFPVSAVEFIAAILE
jgi:hypothetical protein